MSLTTDPRVWRREGVKDGRPTVRGSKVSVIQVLSMMDRAGMRPEEIAEQYDTIPSVEAVRDAVSWANDNSDVVEELCRERRRVRRQVRREKKVV